MAKIKISEIQTVKAKTRFGEKDKYLIKTSNGNEASSFVGSWNKDWRAGDEVECEVKKNESNGKTYVNLECPPELKKQFSSGGLSDADRAMLSRIENKIDSILEAINSSEDEAPLPDEPPVSEETPIQDLDF